jgi:hypothetical protein
LARHLRDTELARTHPLSEKLAALNRGDGFTRINLAMQLELLDRQRWHTRTELATRRRARAALLNPSQ